MNPSQKQSINQNRLLIVRSVLDLVCASKFLKIQDLPSRGEHLFHWLQKSSAKLVLTWHLDSWSSAKLIFTLSDCWVIPVKTFPKFPLEEIYQTGIWHYSFASCWWTIKYIAFLQQFSHSYQFRFACMITQISKVVLTGAVQTMIRQKSVIGCQYITLQTESFSLLYWTEILSLDIYEVWSRIFHFFVICFFWCLMMPPSCCSHFL